MVELILYFTASYLVVLTIAAIVVVVRHFRAVPNQWSAKQRAQRLLATTVIVSLMLVAPAYPYLSLALRTTLHRPGLQPAVVGALEKNWGSPAFERLHVLSVNGRFARVLVEHEGIGDVLDFQRDASGWAWTGDFETIWSDYGSADGNVFPPLPH